VKRRLLSLPFFGRTFFPFSPGKERDGDHFFSADLRHTSSSSERSYERRALLSIFQPLSLLSPPGITCPPSPSVRCTFRPSSPFRMRVLYPRRRPTSSFPGSLLSFLRRRQEPPLPEGNAGILPQYARRPARLNTNFSLFPRLAPPLFSSRRCRCRFAPPEPGQRSFPVSFLLQTGGNVSTPS